MYDPFGNHGGHYDPYGNLQSAGYPVPYQAQLAPYSYQPVRQQFPRTATARITGGPLAPRIRGIVTFTEFGRGTWVAVNVEGLPEYRPATAGQDPVGPFGFHIHEKGVCEIGDPNNPFQGTGGHWNPTNQPHGNHVSDFPVLFSNDGRAIMGFYTNRFLPAEVIGRAVIIHQNPDDYRTQPSGDTGKHLACGVIMGGTA
ncbi:superoxide dismutase family protein [Brevibacillus dissolubilis]|uniref:superoxide dismutase family protein n=1 Tax=Brevibacillus dissolubilis TaxID=1844116 RepID=UPI001116BB78|nr:superoxide dismutase family protein [Brevibacillus dissolubilis]